MSAAVSRRDRLPLYALFAANAISMLGNMLTFVAIPWFVLQTTGSATKTGLTVAVGAVPVVIAGIFGGAIVDRMGYKRASIVADVSSGLTVMLIPLLHHTIGLEYWQLLVLVFTGAILDAPGNTARRSIFPELAERAGMQLERGNAIFQMVRRFAGLLGPPLAGILIAAFGASNVLWIDAFTFAVSALIVAVGVPRIIAAGQDDGQESPPSRYLQEVAEGFRFIRRDRPIFWMMIAMSVGSLLAEPLYSVVLPVYANEVLGSAVDLGLIFAALAAGSLAGNGLYILFGTRIPRRPLMIGGFALRAATFWVLVMMPSLEIIALVIFLDSVFLEPVNPLYMTIMHERIPAGLRGRVFGAAVAIGMCTLPIGMIAYGYLLEATSLQATLVILASVNLLLPLGMLLLPAFHLLEKPAETAGLPLERARAVTIDG